ncbi:Vacuolar fusion CCZ1 [Gossypium arboreum]|uniref:Vacuolar fusion CCZ1 n=1 Tax=Gossypium arboreum TaxID=29729 RepID=A0A0B0NRE3_GOSAR|nr:Vacuolar fusion CCZ1 [Gossypium arboreum]
MSISNKNQALDNIKDRERVGTISKQKQKFTHTARSKSFARVADDKEKLKDKRAEYEVIASSDSSVNLNDIDNRIITKILGPERYDRVRFQGYFVNPTQYFRSSSQQYMPSRNQAQAEVQRLRDQMA